jgi:hypothetical protein
MTTGQDHAWASSGSFPWLLCNMASGLLCAWIAWRYEGLVREVAMLAMFIPLVLAMGESVSMQAMTRRCIICAWPPVLAAGVEDDPGGISDRGDAGNGLRGDPDRCGDGLVRPAGSCAGDRV